MKYLLCFLLCLILFSCNNDPLKTVSTENNNFSVELLFTVDGIRVYRFWDGIRPHYFTTHGETITTQTYLIGKTYHYYDENISGQHGQDIGQAQI